MIRVRIPPPAADRDALAFTGERRHRPLPSTLTIEPDPADTGRARRPCEGRRQPSPPSRRGVPLMTTPVVASPRLRSVLLVILLCLGAAAPLSAQLKTKQNVTGVGRRAVVQGKGPKVPAGRSFDIINLEGL